MNYDRAAAMMSYVGLYYQRSRINRAQNEAKAAEHNALRTLIDEVAAQFFVETATWGIDRWEAYCGLQANDGDSIEVRRQRVISWLQIISPITPYVMKTICEGAVHTEVEIDRNVAPYTFGVYFDFLNISKVNILDLLNVIEEAKPAHLAVFFRIRLFAADCDMKFGVSLCEVNHADIMPYYLKGIKEDLRLISAGALSSVADTTIEPVSLEEIDTVAMLVGTGAASAVLDTTIDPHKFDAIDWGYTGTTAAFAFSIVAVTINPLYATSSASGGTVQYAAATSSVQSIIINSKED